MYFVPRRGARNQAWRAQESDWLERPLLGDTDFHILQHGQRAAMKGHAQEEIQGFNHSSNHATVEDGQRRLNDHTSGYAEAIVSDPATLQQPMQSPFGIHQPTFKDEEELNASLNQVTRKTPKDRWRDAGKKVAEKVTIRFGQDTVDETPGTSSDDTAHKGNPSGTTPLERKSSSLMGRSSLNLSKLGKSFSDNRSGGHALAETVKLAQQQQQANRSSAAPVLKAVPSTKVSTSILNECFPQLVSSMRTRLQCAITFRLCVTDSSLFQSFGVMAFSC